MRSLDTNHRQSWVKPLAFVDVITHGQRGDFDQTQAGSKPPFFVYAWPLPLLADH